VFQIELEILNYQSFDTLTPSLKIGEVMEFQSWLIAKQNMGKTGLKTGLYSSVWTIKTNNL
jgi:hypothetical protein